MKKVLLSLFAVLLLFSMAACAANDADQTADSTDQTADATDPPADTATEDTQSPDAPDADAETDVPAAPIPVATLAGPTGMGMVQMMDNDAYDISILTSPDQITPKIINGEVSAAAIPSNLGALLYNKLGGQIQVVAVNTTGVLYILENGDTVSSLEDLAGKTIYATGQGATPEYVLNKILADNGLDDVNVEYMGAHADLANALASGEVTLALLPEPFVSVVLAKNSDVSVKIDINKEWQSIFGEDAAIPMGVLVASSEFAADTDAMDQLIADYSASVEYVNGDIPSASEDIAAAGIVASGAVAASAIPRCGITFQTGEACKAMLADYFDVMYESNPESLGGALPGDDFYFMP
jgi:NitT/TauT family transport system substrate-binding protein